MADLIDSYSEANVDDTLNGKKYIGQTFTSPGGYLLDSAKFYLKRGTALTGNIYALLYALTGTPGTDAVPTGSILATSDAVAASSVGAAYALIEFTFSGAERVELAAQDYGICYYLESGNTSDSLLGFDASSATHGGNVFWSVTDGTTWDKLGAGFDAAFYVYGADAASGGGEMLLLGIG